VPTTVRDSSRVRIHAQIAIVIALATVFDLFSKSVPLPRMPYGGSISVAMLPVMVLALLRGWRVGVVAGILYGIVALVREQHFIHPIQLLMDYPLAFGAIGLTGIATLKESSQTSLLRLRVGVAVLVSSGFRFCAHFVSGFIFWAQFAPEGQPVWLYSFLYNGSYMLVETILDMVLIQVVLLRIRDL
jgi:thiamine transporter